MELVFLEVFLFLRAESLIDFQLFLGFVLLGFVFGLLRLRVRLLCLFGC